MTLPTHLGFLGGIVVLLVAPVQGQSPIDQERNVHEVIVGPAPPVATLAELSQQSDLIVVGTLLSTSEPVVMDKTVVREQRIQVDEVITDARAVLNGPVLRLRIVGGTVRRGDAEFRTSHNMQPLLPTERALLFLDIIDKDAGGTVFVPSAGNRSVFRAPKDASPAETRFSAHPTAQHFPELKQGRPTLDALRTYLRGLR